MPLSRLLVRVLLLVCLLAGALAGVAAGPTAVADDDPVGDWPLRPRPDVVRGFDPPDVAWGSGHRGVDLLGFPGQRVRTALAGTVTFAGLLAGRGVVVVSHGATRTTYEPVTSSVAVGAQVSQGDTLGRLAFFGSHCLPRACLHWGWLRGETYLDPLGLVGAAVVRLLPLWRSEPVALTAPQPARAFSVPPWRGSYAALLEQRPRLARSPPEVAQARGCACW